MEIIMKIEYTKVGDYYLPNLYYPEETRPIGFWGMLWKEYLKEHKPGTYTYLLLTARLDSYLTDLNEQAQERFELIEAQMQSTEGVTEELKRQNPMEGIVAKEMYIRGFLDYERLVCEKDRKI